MARLSVRGLDKNVLSQFRHKVESDHGKLHGMLGREVSKAMEDYLQEKPNEDDISRQTQQAQQLEALIEELEQAISELKDLLNNFQFLP